MSIFNIAWKLIFSKKQFSYTTVSIFLSLIVSILSIATSISILGISRNYENSIKKTISTIEPQITVNHIYNDMILTSIVDSIIKDIYLNSIGYMNFSSDACEYLESYAMIKNKKKSIGVLVYGMDERCLHSIYDFIGSPSNNTIFNNHDFKENSEFLYLSEFIYDEIVDEGSKEIYLFNLPQIVEKQSIKALKAKITTLYKSKIKMFDEKVVFTSLKQFNELFDLDGSLYSGIMINNLSHLDLNEIGRIENNFDVLFLKWEDKYENLLKWLTIFSNPIKLIMSFILILSSIYFLFAFFLLLYDKSNTILKFRVLGISIIIINRITLIISLIFSMISILIGSVVAIFFQYSIKKFNLVQLDSEIYLIENLYSSIIFSDIFYIGILYLSLTIIPVLFLAKIKTPKVVPSK